MSLYKIAGPAENEPYDPEMLAVAILDGEERKAYWYAFDDGNGEGKYVSFEPGSFEHEEAEDEINDFEEHRWMWDNGSRSEKIIPYTREALEKFARENP